MPTLSSRRLITAAALTISTGLAGCLITLDDPSRFNHATDVLITDTTADSAVRDPDARSVTDSGPDAEPGVDGRTDTADTTTPDTATADTEPAPSDADINDTPDAQPSDTVAIPDTPVNPEGEITVATWNVRRLFDTNCDSGFCDESDFETAYSAPQFNFRVNQVVAGIDALGADIVLLQEIETQTSLNALAAALGDRYGVHVLGETDFAASLDVAVVGNGDLQGVTTHRQTRIPLPSGGTTTFAREFLEIELRVDGHAVIVFNAHFKSQNDDDPARRLAEGRAAAAIVAERIEERPDALIILGGDLNDEPGSPAIDAIEASGALLRVASELGAGAGTVTFNGRANALDHLFVCRDACSGGYVAGSAEVVRSSGSQALSGSDHAGLRARFRLD